MPLTRTASQVLEEEFLVLRAKLLEVAAGMDRLDRASGSAAEDHRHALLIQAIDILRSDSPNRAERLQLLFSREYASDWRAAMRMETSTDA